MTKQSISRYSSLISRIAIVLMVSCILMYFGGRVVGFSRWLIIAAEGYTILADIVFLALDCAVTFLAIYLIPVKIFDYSHRNAFKEKNMPVERKIISKNLIAPVFILGLCLNYVAYYANAYGVSRGIDMYKSLTDLTGFGQDYLFLSGMKYGYQIVIYVISIAVIPAVFEELIFRKTFCDALAPYGPTTAIIVTSVLFSLMHTDAGRIYHTFVMGVFCSWLYIGTKNIRIPMLLHFLSNLFAAIETIAQYRVSEDFAVKLMATRLVVFFLISVICLVYLIINRKKQISEREREARESGEYETYRANKIKYAHRIEMLPDEDGEEVLALSRKEKVRGFFTPTMIVFIILVFIQMGYWLSFMLV